MVKPYSPRLSLMELFLQAGWELSPEFQHSRALARPIAREARDLMPPHPRTLEPRGEEERGWARGSQGNLTRHWF